MVLRRASALLAGVVILPLAANAQSNGAAPQTIPGLDRFSLPPKPTPTPAPPPSGPVVAPLAKPTPSPNPAPQPSASATPVVPPPVTSTVPGGTTVSAPQRRPVPQTSTTPQASTTPQPGATPQVTPSTLPAAPTATPIPDMTIGTSAPVSAGPSTETLVALGVGALALLAAGWFLFARRRRAAAEPEVELELTDVAPSAAPPPAPPPPPPPARGGLLTVPLRRAPEPPPGLLTVPAPRAAAPGPGMERGEPMIEIVLMPQRAGTDADMLPAVEYRIVVRNVGAGTARDIRLGIYMMSASARQGADLQAIFAASVDKPAVDPFVLAAGQQLELNGTASLSREHVNVMTIEGKPWFVPVMAMKAEYRWGENVGAPGAATAAHMIGIDRGEGAKMQPFRLDGDPKMHPRVAERKVA